MKFWDGMTDKANIKNTDFLMISDEDTDEPQRGSVEQLFDFKNGLDETITGQKTFDKSPKVPEPVEGEDAAQAGWVDFKFRNKKNSLFVICTKNDSDLVKIDYIKKAISSIYVFGAVDYNAKYSIASFSNKLHSGSAYIIMLRIFKQIGDVTTEVCSVNYFSTSLKSGTEKLNLQPVNDSGIYASVVVNWDYLVGTEFYNINPDLYYFDEDCFKEGSFNNSFENTNFIKPIKYAAKYELGKNLFNNRNLKDGYWLNINTGALYYQGHGFMTSHFMRVNPSTPYTISGYYGMTSGAGFSYSIFSKDKTTIKAHAQITTITKTLTTPASGDDYLLLIFCVYRSSGGVPNYPFAGEMCQVEAGGTATAYELFKPSITDEFNNRFDAFNSDNLNVIMPNQINVAVGRQINIYKDNLADTLPDHDYFISKKFLKLTSDTEFLEMKRSCRYTPSTVKYLTTIFTVKHGMGGILFRKNVTFNSVSKTAGTGVKKTLFIGDSLMAYGAITGEILNLFNSDGGGQINLIGHIGIGSNRYEARGGWSFEDYTTNKRKRFYLTVVGFTSSIDIVNDYVVIAGTYHRIDKYSLDGSGNGTLELTLDFGTEINSTSGTFTHNGISYVYTNLTKDNSGNPFWNLSSNSLDFANYMSTYNSGVNLDIAVIQLGVNGVYAADPNVPEILSQASTLKNAIVSAFPNAKIIFSLEPFAPYSDGYSGLRGYIDLDLYRINMFKLYSGIISLISENISVAYSNLCIDRLYGYGAMLKNVNSRTSLQNHECGGGVYDVHPSAEGSNQIADCIYSQMRHIM